jgi:hypothetical protein
MTDLLLVALILGFFLATLGLAWMVERLMR